jgi:hypothetical protein
MSSTCLGVGRTWRPHLMLLYCALFLTGGSTYPAMAGSQTQDQKGRPPAVVGSVLERLQHIVPEVERAENCPRAQQFAARYSAETPQTAGIIGGTSGDSLYLFRDGSYLYVEWADILPETMMDQGRWSLQGGLLVLGSDGVSSDKGSLQDVQYVAFCPPGSGRRALRIIGRDHQLGMLEDHFTKDPGSADDRRFLVMLYSRERLEEYVTPEASQQARENLRRRLERAGRRT